MDESREASVIWFSVRVARVKLALDLLIPRGSIGVRSCCLTGMSANFDELLISIYRWGFGLFVNRCDLRVEI